MFIRDGRYGFPDGIFYDVVIKNGTITISSTSEQKQPEVLDLIKNMRTDEIYFVKDGTTIYLSQLKYIEPYHINFPYNICDLNHGTKRGTIVPIEMTDECVTFRLWFDDDFLQELNLDIRYMDLTYEKDKIERKNVIEFLDVYFEFCYD